MPEISLYIHIPFCIKRCSYCDFITFTNNPARQIDKYVEKICQELAHYQKENLKLKTIFFGGGTPSVLKIEALEKIFATINKNFAFSAEPEITIEINPVNLSRSNLKKYKNLGINRLSMGVQTFNEKLLAEINRDHQVKDIYQTYQAAREAGFKNFNLDLIFGLPGQTAEDWEVTIEKALNLKPEHISIYGLDLHDNTPLYEEVERKEKELPPEKESIKMFEIARKELRKNNFRHYEISNWSQPGKEAKHNLTYWRNEEYLGIGVSAASYYQKKRFTNTSDLLVYLKKEDFENDQLVQKQKEELEETVFLNLRLLKEGLDTAVFKKRFSLDFAEYYQEELSELFQQGLLQKKGTKLRLTTKALLLSNEVFAKFLKD